MKYIRTENEICELDDNWALFCQEYANNKQADTIKELCDELVIHNPDNDGHFYSKTFVYKGDWEIMLEPMNDYEKSNGIEIYGSIWVFDDNGAPTLKPVAKKNENGDLKLL